VSLPPKAKPAFRAVHDTVVTELPNGLYMLRKPGDEYLVLYPADMLAAIQAAFTLRLEAEKQEHAEALQQMHELERRVLELEAPPALDGAS
jgi:hypothetical protein